MADERTLVADIKSYIDELDNGFKAEVEEHPQGSITRVDLIVRYNNQVLFKVFIRFYLVRKFYIIYISAH